MSGEVRSLGGRLFLADLTGYRREGHNNHAFTLVSYSNHCANLGPFEVQQDASFLVQAFINEGLRAQYSALASG